MTAPCPPISTGGLALIAFLSWGGGLDIKGLAAQGPSYVMALRLRFGALLATLHCVDRSSSAITCCNTLTVAQTESVRPDYMGSYTQVSGTERAGRPVWVNENGKYIYAHNLQVGWSSRPHWCVGDQIDDLSNTVILAPQHAGGLPFCPPAVAQNDWTVLVATNNWTAQPVSFTCTEKTVGGTEGFVARVGEAYCTDSGFLDLDDAAECTTAAQALNLELITYSSAQVQSMGAAPHGCYWSTPTMPFVFNTGGGDKTSRADAYGNPLFMICRESSRTNSPTSSPTASPTSSPTTAPTTPAPTPYPTRSPGATEDDGHTLTVTFPINFTSLDAAARVSIEEQMWNRIETSSADAVTRMKIKTTRIESAGATSTRVKVTFFVDVELPAAVSLETSFAEDSVSVTVSGQTYVSASAVLSSPPDTDTGGEDEALSTAAIVGIATAASFFAALVAVGIVKRGKKRRIGKIHPLPKERRESQGPGLSHHDFGELLKEI